MKHIKGLPEAVHSSMRSGVVICDLTRIVEELVLNSIDAGATEVSVAVRVGNCYIKVVDNGSGITRDGLVLLGEQYATSKFDPMDSMDAGMESFDFHGETLCSISDISLLEIVTKARGRPNGYKKIMKNRKCLFLSISDDRLDSGTTVTARDIFYNQPVRRKHMESSPKVLESIRMSVLRISLIHVNASFKVMDSESACELLHVGPSHPPLSILFSNSRIGGALHRLNISSGALNVSGHISPPLQNFSLKVIQYIYINSRFICKGPIHKLLNQLATKFDVSNSSKPTAGSQNVKRNKGQMGPTFILNLSCPRSHYDIVASEQSRTSVEFKDWGPVLSCIENGVVNLWTENLSHATFESGRKRFRGQNIPTSIDLDTTQLKNLSENYDNFHAWEECASSRRETSPKVYKVKKHQSGAGFWPDADYLSRSCDQSQSGHRVSKNEDSSCRRNPCCVFSPDCYHFIGYSSDKQEAGVSFPEMGFLQKTYADTNNMSMSRTSVGCLALGDDIPINRDLRKSLRRCYFQRSFPHDKKSSADDERSEFESQDLRIQEKWVDCDKNVENEICPVFYGRDVPCNKEPPFQDSPMIPYDTHEDLEFMIRDSLDSTEVFSDIITDSCKHFLNCKSSQQSSGSGRCPITAKQIVGTKFPETLVESHSEFDEDSTQGYFIHREDDDLVGGNSSLKGNWFRQSCSIMNSFLDQKKGIGDYDWDDFENSPSEYPLETFCETDWSPLPFFNDNSSKRYSVSSFDHDPLLENDCGRPNDRMQERTSNRKKSSIRSRSAPPCYKGKKRFFGLSDSSSVSARSSCQMIAKTLLSTGPSSLNPALLHEENVSLRPGLERTPETIKIQDGISPKQQLTSMETVGNFQEIHDPLDSGQKWRKYCLPAEGGHARCYNKDQDTILDISSDSFHLIRDSLVPTTIDKTSLDDAKVLNQVDKKFIAVVARETLIVIDQHAADERIRLEELRHKVLSGEMKKITYLDAEQEMVFPEIGYQLLHNYEEQIQKWGWICNIHSRGTGSFTRSIDHLHRQATAVKLLAVPCIVGVNLTDGDLLEFLQQLGDTDGSSTIPPSVHRVLNSKACRGAIMFGDTLLPSECSLIVEELKQTSLCFQCAHGRPTTVPLVNLAILHDKITKLGSQKLWHGLHQHELSIQRSAQRLSSAIG
ncbi:DNA mismatch repair protein MLH3 isoform X2 [Primulina eburnea]|uniref:DNA mismatch repair protein MLH3 isoform X2 n=1 Tax=Primulina eburnea TaxID=1245227 RepID=UPI003C6CA482